MTHLGVKPAPFPPVYEPEVVAEAIVRVAQSPVRNELLTASAVGMRALDVVAPRAADGYFERVGYASQRTSEAKSPTAPNNLWQPVPGPGAVRGTFGAAPFDPLSWVRQRPAVRSALTAVGLAALVFPLAGFILRGTFGGCVGAEFD